MLPDSPPTTRSCTCGAQRRRFRLFVRSLGATDRGHWWALRPYRSCVFRRSTTSPGWSNRLRRTRPGGIGACKSPDIAAADGGDAGLEWSTRGNHRDEDMSPSRVVVERLGTATTNESRLTTLDRTAPWATLGQEVILGAVWLVFGVEFRRRVRPARRCAGQPPAVPGPTSQCVHRGPGRGRQLVATVRRDQPGHPWHPLPGNGKASGVTIHRSWSEGVHPRERVL